MERSTKNRLMYFRKHPSRFGGFVMPWKMNLSPVKRFLGNRMLQALQVLKVQVQSVDNRSRGKEIYRGGMDSEVLSGRVLEWSNRTVSKTVVPATVPWVRIPPLPLYKKAVSRETVFLSRSRNKIFSVPFLFLRRGESEKNGNEAFWSWFRRFIKIPLCIPVSFPQRKSF